MRDSHQEDQPDAYAALHAQFGWRVDTHLNMAQLCCGRWAAAPDAARRVALKEGTFKTLYFYCTASQDLKNKDHKYNLRAR